MGRTCERDHRVVALLISIDSHGIIASDIFFSNFLWVKN